jgi:hypothetical protein
MASVQTVVEITKVSQKSCLKLPRTFIANRYDPRTCMPEH